MLSRLIKFLPLSIVLIYVFSGQIQAAETNKGRHFYCKEHSQTQTDYEKLLIKHASESFERALRKESKLSANIEYNNDLSFNSRYGTVPFYHLLNNVCSLENAAHLHIGLLNGGSFTAALYGNQDLLTDKIGIDILSTKTSINVYKKYLKNDYQVIICDCFKIDRRRTQRKPSALAVGIAAPKKSFNIFK